MKNDPSKTDLDNQCQWAIKMAHSDQTTRISFVGHFLYMYTVCMDY